MTPHGMKRPLPDQERPGDTSSELQPQSEPQKPDQDSPLDRSRSPREAQPEQTSGEPLLPLADSGELPQPDSLDDTLSYSDKDDTREYVALFGSQFDVPARSWMDELIKAGQEEEEEQCNMLTEVQAFLDWNPDVYWYDMFRSNIYRVDDSTANLTEDDMRRYASLVIEGDRKELEQFIKFDVFEVVARAQLPPKANVVDCTWVRKWKVKGKVVKSRLCSRGCFDRQKYQIEKHSSTATRLSQRVVLSLGMCDGALDASFTNGPEDHIDTESLDISSAFLQGLEYRDLEKQARALGYEVKTPRAVFVDPPENVWWHWRSMRDTPKALRVPDDMRAKFVLRCKRAMYGFVDAPLMFQLALICFLINDTGAIKSVWDDNYLYWIWDGKHVLSMTAHVDDLQVTGTKFCRDWLYRKLTERFGALKRQTMPYTHAGIQLERVHHDCLLLHQEAFVQALRPHPVDRHRPLDEKLSDAEVKVFRSLICSCLWAGQTRPDELCRITSLQQKLREPTVADLKAANSTIKRLQQSCGTCSTTGRHGIFMRRLQYPLRLVTVSDASSANKASNFATEGGLVLLGEDRASGIMAATNAGDFAGEDWAKLLGGSFHTLVALSQKSKRVSYSTSHAETNAAARLVPVGQLAALRYVEPELAMELGRAPRALDVMQYLERQRCSLPCDHVVDCMDLWELCCGYRGIPQDKGQRLGVLMMREERRSLRLRRLYHLRTRWMLADMLTKFENPDSRSLLELASSGRWTVGGDVRVRHGFGQAPRSSTPWS